MQQTTEMADATRTRLNFARNLSRTVLYAILLCCSGCFRHRITIENGYRLKENSGAPMLVPIDGQSSNPGEFQISKVFLAGPASGRNQIASHCAINGKIFSFHSVSASDLRHWIVRSPSTAGWNTLETEIDIDSQWRSFTRDLMRLKAEGCFPAGATVFEIRSAVAQRIPLPADEVPLFFYSDQGMEFVDLAPRMEIRLQQILATGKPISAHSRGTYRMWLANYKVVPRHREGVRLKLTTRIQRGPKIGSGSEEKKLFFLSQRFAQTDALRLLLKGFSASHPASDAILIGASNDKQLNIVSKLILRADPAGCVDYHGTVCMEFPRGALSLFSTIWVDGHRTSYPFGTPLASVLRSFPQPEQSKVLQSARILRRLSLDHYAEIQFPRTRSGASQLLLLPGDRIQWKH